MLTKSDLQRPFQSKSQKKKQSDSQDNDDESDSKGGSDSSDDDESTSKRSPNFHKTLALAYTVLELANTLTSFDTQKDMENYGE
eukprot:Awhi_evm1s10473